MPNQTKEEPSPSSYSSGHWKADPTIMNKSWVELAAEEEDFFEGLPDSLEVKTEPTEEAQPEVKLNLTPVKEEPIETPEDKPARALRSIDFGAPIKEEVMESPMKVESPLKTMESPAKLDEESPMKTGTPVKMEQSPSSKQASDVSKRLWASPRRHRQSPSLNVGPSVSPRRPTSAPRNLFSPSQRGSPRQILGANTGNDLMSPPRDPLSRKRPHQPDFFNRGSPASSIGSPGSDRLQSPRAKRNKPPPRELELDPEVLNRRQKQIDYGKNTEGYRCYLETIPKHHRHHRHPQTPPRDYKYSRRAWDGMVRAWRQHLHNWDPPGLEGTEDPLDCLDMSDSMSEASGSHLSDNVSELSYPGSGTKLKPQRPSSNLSLDEFPPLC